MNITYQFNGEPRTESPMIERMHAYKEHYLRCYNAALERGDQSAAEINQKLFYDMLDRLVELRAN